MNVSSVKNLNGETFSAVQDTALTNVVQANSATWNEISAYELASASYLTAHQDLSDYATTAELASKQDTLTFGYDEQDRINSINSSALAGGGDVPEDVMVETNLEYNSQGYINGYNGSAVATIDQERQWFTHDDTLCHLSNSAQYALGCNVPVIAQQIGIDETVLWSGTPSTTAYNMTLSDNLNNYNYFVVIWKSYQRVYRDGFVANTTAYPLMLGALFVNSDGNYEKSMTTWATTDGLTYNWKATIHGSFTGTQSNQWNGNVVPLEIHGIGKKV